MQHAKPVIINGAVSTVGSSNLDWRSLMLTDEIGAAFSSEAFAQRMQAMFQSDLEMRTGHHAIEFCAD